MNNSGLSGFTNGFQYDKDRALRAQIHELKLSVANRTIEKAEHFFSICAENGLDVDRILRRDTVALAQLKRPAIEPGTPSSATTTRSVVMSPTGGGGGGVGRSYSPELESEMVRMARERDSLSEEVKSLESNYSNLFKLYEKMRENCVQLKVGSAELKIHFIHFQAIEDHLRLEISDQSQKYSSLYTLYSDLLNDAQDKLNSADAEVQRIMRESEERSLGIRLSLKKAQVQNQTLSAALESKTRENEELNKICNELIAKAHQAGGGDVSDRSGAGSGGGTARLS